MIRRLVLWLSRRADRLFAECYGYDHRTPCHQCPRCEEARFWRRWAERLSL